MTRQEMYSMALFARVLNATAGKGEKPFAPDWPWDTKPKPEEVTPEERAALVARLKAKSAFGQKRTET